MTSNRRRWFYFGPGTVIALIVALGFVFSAWWVNKKAAPDPNLGRIVYEANEQGKLHSVPVPNTQHPTPNARPPTSRLWKPEVSFLIEHTSELRLDKRQISRIKAFDAAWLKEKSQLEEAMNKSLSRANQKLSGQTDRKTSASEIAVELGDYSQLSVHYNERRTYYWTQATALLSKEQFKQLETLAEAMRRKP